MLKRIIFLWVLGLVPLISLAQEQPKKKKVEGEEKPSFAEKVYFGGNFGLQFGTVTFIDISPIVGFKVTEDFSVGTGISYRYIKYLGMTNGINIYGPRAFARYNIFENLFTYGEYEILNGNWNGQGVSTIENILAGGGYSYRIGNSANAFIMVLWNFSQNQYSPYTNPVIRAGFNFGIR